MEPIETNIVNKEKSNFCVFFQMRDVVKRPGGIRSSDDSKDDRKGRFVRGSWDPANHRLGSRGGRVYCTAMAILSLEVYYRFLPIYKINK